MGIHLIVISFLCTTDALSYASGSVASGRASRAGQAK